MNKNEIIQRVANGLRYMNEQPDALLFSTNKDYTWDNTHILDILVLHSDIYINFNYNDTIYNECPFMPIWFNERSTKYAISKKFFQGWDDFSW